VGIINEKTRAEYYR